MRIAHGQGNPCHAYAFGAQAVEVEVDTETGIVNVVRSVFACDVGKAINPVNVEGQMEGGVAQAYLSRHGVPAEAILVESEGESTVHSIAAAAEPGRVAVKQN